MQRSVRLLTRLGRLGLAWTLVFALIAAPLLMHRGASQAASHQHHGQPAPHPHTMHAPGHDGHRMGVHNSNTGDLQASTEQQQAGGACFFCVICVGAVGVGPATVALQYRHETPLPARTPVLASLQPEPGIRPPLA